MIVNFVKSLLFVLARVSKYPMLNFKEKRKSGFEGPTITFEYRPTLPAEEFSIVAYPSGIVFYGTSPKISDGEDLESLAHTVALAWQKYQELARLQE